MNNKIEVKVKKVMSETFNCKQKEINKNTSIHQLQRWDSINHFLLISNLEQAFKIKLQPGEAETMISFKIIYATMKSYAKKN